MFFDNQQIYIKLIKVPFYLFDKKYSSEVQEEKYHVICYVQNALLSNKNTNGMNKQ